MEKKNRILVIVISVFFLTMSLWAICGEKPEYSESERRVLAKFPEFEMENILNGKFAKGFDEYNVDRFPTRDSLRSVKAYVKTTLFGQKDNNQIYTCGKHISKMEYPMNTAMLDYAAELFANIKDTYLQDNNIYLAIIPDKNRYLAEESGHLHMDYDAFSKYLSERMEYAKYVEIADLLEADDYYFTDTHWRQEKIVDVAERIADAMDVKLSADYEQKKIENPFYGVYVGQSALKWEPDTILYLENEMTKAAVVEGAKGIYDKSKATGKDPYEMFLSGNQPIVSIKNKENTSGKKLIMFRDSFGSSIAPLFIEAYSEIILVDLRYIPSSMLEEEIDFNNADVLFLYNTLILNNSRSMK